MKRRKVVEPSCMCVTRARMAPQEVLSECVAAVKGITVQLQYVETFLLLLMLFVTVTMTLLCHHYYCYCDDFG